MFAAKMFENRLLDAYREKAALEAQERLIQEEEDAEKEKEERQRLKKEKEKERKKARKERKKAAKANENADALPANRDAEEAKAKAEAKAEADRKAEELERQKRHAEEERLREAELKKRQEAREAKEAAEAAARVAAAEAVQAKVAKPTAEAAAKREMKSASAQGALQDNDSGQWESSSKGRRGRKQRGGVEVGSAQAKGRDGTGPNLNLSALRGTGVPNGAGVAIGRMGLVGGQKPPAQFQPQMVPLSRPLGVPTPQPPLQQPLAVQPQSTQPQPMPPPLPPQQQQQQQQPQQQTQSGNMWNTPLSESPGGQNAQSVSPPQGNGIFHQSLPSSQGFDAGVPPPPPRDKALEPAGSALEGGIDSEISRMLDLLPGDLLGGNEFSPQGLDSSEFQVPSETQADHAPWNDSSAFAGANATWDVPQTSALGMGGAMGQESYIASQGL